MVLTGEVGCGVVGWWAIKHGCVFEFGCGGGTRQFLKK